MTDLNKCLGKACRYFEMEPAPCIHNGFLPHCGPTLKAARKKELSGNIKYRTFDSVTGKYEYITQAEFNQLPVYPTLDSLSQMNYDPVDSEHPEEE